MKRVVSLFKNKLINGTRYFLVHRMPGICDFILLTEYPRSGGTWLGQMLSAYLDIPFPRNTFPVFRTSVVHGHFLPFQKAERIHRIVWLVRDGRDVMVSMYYHSLLPNEENIKHPKDLNYFRKKLGFRDVHDIGNNLPAFMEFLCGDRPSRFTRFSHEGNWGDFNRKWHDYTDISAVSGNIIRTSYEELLRNTGDTLAGIIGGLSGAPVDADRIRRVAEQFRFSRQTRRKPGVEDRTAFRRKGISGDWRNVFTREAAEVFDHYYGDSLIMLGYEPDRRWVETL